MFRILLISVHLNLHLINNRSLCVNTTLRHTTMNNEYIEVWLC